MGRALRFDDLYAFERVADPSFNPDGRRVAYTVTTADKDTDGYRSRIWVTSLDGDARPFTSGQHDTSPRWSPDGAWLAFVRADAGTPQLWVLPTAGGDARCIDAGPVLGFEWSPAGDRFAVVKLVDLRGEATDEAEAKRRETAPVEIERFGFKADGAGLIGSRRTHLFTVGLEGGEATQLTEGDSSVAAPAWSPDGQTIAVLTALHDERDLDAVNHAALVPAAGGGLTIVTDWQGLAGWVGWLPDGQRLMLAGLSEVDTALHNALFTVPVSGGKPEPLLVDFDRNVMTGGPGYPGALPQIGDDDVVFCARHQGTVHLYVADLESGTVRTLMDDLDHLIAGCTRTGDRIAYVLADPTCLGEILTRTLDSDDDPHQLTEHNAWLDDIELQRAMPRMFDAPDGALVPGRVLGADRGAPRPLLLDIHGGPHNAWGPALDDVHLYHQVLVSEGWAVLLLNTVGSDGYGQDWYAGLRGGWGAHDEAQFHAAIDTLIDEGVADPERLAVAGYSYGGFMTNWLLSRSDRFAAAATGGCVTNLSSFYGTSDSGPLLLACELGAELPEDPARYTQLSPLTGAATITTPTLILHGEEDHRCPVGQAEELFTALRRRRTPTRLVRYPGAGHLFILEGKPSHRLHFNTQIHSWLVDHTR